MKKIGIITCYDLNNYGNRLQNYASQCFLNSLGMSAVSFVERSKKEKGIYIMDGKYIFHRLTRFCFSSYPEGWNDYSVMRIRKRRFRFFQRKINTRYVSKLERLAKKAVFFVAGSDQIWQPKWWRQHDNEMYLLSFARPEQKLCLSPSFGVDKLESSYSDIFKEALSTFALLNCRESAGANIIKELTGREAAVIIDPTLLLSADDWRKVSFSPSGIKTDQPYLLTYFLGSVPEQASQDIEYLLARDPELKVFHLNNRAYSDLYACGPAEFLNLIDHAQIVLTDSFHACVFSFIFSKPFGVYNRTVTDFAPAMTSRIDTLLSTFGLERKRRINSDEIDWFESDYSKSFEKLKEEQKKVRAVIAEAVK